MIETNFWLFLAAACLIAAIPGPGIFYVAARTLSEGRATRTQLLTGRPQLVRRLSQGSGIFIASLGLSLALARRPMNG